ncbi:MAG: sulfatase-like hydrolase/transferase [Bacteroidetes bacterium]|nr:sulfatase-like hydrolase/transferase [Bacteroidota bacterium]
MRKWKISKTIQWMIKLFIIYLCMFTAFRIGTVIFYKPETIGVFELLPSFWLGLKYDLRWIAIVLSPIIVLSIFKRFSPFHSERNKKIWTYYLAVITLVIMFFYGADYGNFSYNHTRIAASALNFKDDPHEMFGMLWESYPILWILFALAVAVFLAAKLFNRIHGSVDANNYWHKFEYKRRWYLLALLLMFWFVYGFLQLKPLTRGDAYKLNDNFKSYLALNPFQNFITSLKQRKPDFNTSGAFTHYSTIASYLQLDESTSGKHTYERTVLPNSRGLESKPNVVLVLCESFSMYKSSMSGNKLNSTPYFNEMCKNGIFFDHCFTPTFGTARGIFATITGIPDVQLAKFSTQNAEAVNQQTIINNFEGYNKYYFIGGRSQFNNFRGLMSNVDGIDIYEKGRYHSPDINVWGISDKDLFAEANNVLKDQNKPFFAMIQTAHNHRPFMIPPDEKEFTCDKPDKETLNKNGFESFEEYQAFCYTDFCFKKFIEAARQQPYFNNTIFVFIGDHGVEGESSAVYPKAWNSQRLSDEHVPLLYYAPSLLPPATYHYTVSQIDVLPTLAGMIHQPYTNTTLGRDVINQQDILHAAFIIHHDEGNIGVITDDYYFIKNINITQEELVPVKDNLPALTPYQTDSIKKQLSELTSAIFETSKWMLLNNKKK